jgi:spermidine synthase
MLLLSCFPKCDRGYKIMRKSLIFALLLIGATAMMGQVLLMRELIVVFYGNELSLGAILAAWLFWVAVGSWGLGSLTDRLVNKTLVLSLCQATILLLLPTLLILTRNARAIWGTSPGEIIGFGPMLFSSFLLLAPLCLILGFLFALGCRIFSSLFGIRVQGIGQVYILEAIGASLGGLILNVLLLRTLNPLQIALLLGGINIFSALLIQFSQPERARFRPVKILIVVLLVGSMGFLLGGGGSRLNALSSKLQWRPLNLVHHDHSIYGNIAVTALGEQYSFFQNGLLMFTSGDVMAAEEAVHFSLLAHPSPHRVLLIGGGIGGSLREILKHPVSAIDYVELDPMIIDVARQFLTAEAWEPMDDSKVRVQHLDGRLFVKRSRDRYDVIIVQLPDPYTALLNRFYSLEFFREAKKVLAPDGLLAFSVTSAENYISPELQQFLGCLHQTAKRVFSHVAVIPGEVNHFLATDRPRGISPDPDSLLARLRERHIQTQFVREYYLPSRMSPERVAFLDEAIRGARGVRVNRDFKPVGYLYDMLLWSTHFQSGFRKLIQASSQLDLRHLMIPILALLGLIPVLCRRTTVSAIKLPVLLAIATTGFSEILFQVVTIIGFQVLYGYVYYKLGLILTSFMMGLVLGSWVINRRLGRLKDDLASYVKIQGTVVLYPLLLSLVLMGLASLESGPLSRLGLGSIFAFFPVLAGFIGGLQFPLAYKICLGSGDRVGKTAGLIYGLDLLGSCAGAFLAGTLLVPILGIFTTCLWVAMLNGCVFVLLLMVLLRRPKSTA